MRLLFPLLFVTFLLLAIAWAEPLSQAQVHQPQSHSLTGNQHQKNLGSSQEEGQEENQSRQKRQYWGFPGWGWGPWRRWGWGWRRPWHRWGWGR